LVERTDLASACCGDWLVTPYATSQDDLPVFLLVLCRSITNACPTQGKSR